MTAILALLLLAAPPKTDALVKEYFTADSGRKHEIRTALKDVELTKKDIQKWMPILLKHKHKAGKKLRKKGTNYFYDKKAKRGKYIVGGSNGKGGLVIGLHGGGEGAGDAGGAAGTFGGIAGKFKCVGVFPEVLEKTERGWTTSGTEEFVLELIEAAKRTWKIDPDRVYIVGHSMGGFGSWTLGAHHADLFAGIGPYAGGPVPYTEGGEKYGEVLGIQEGVLPNLRNVALHVYQSLDDVQVPPHANIFANKSILELKEENGGYENYKYVEVDGRGHGAPPGGHVKGFKWLYQFKRVSRPKHVVWQPVLEYKRMFYWLWWDRPDAQQIVEAKIDKPNEIDLDLAGSEREGFRILLDDRLVDLDKEVVVREGGDEIYRGKPKRNLATMLLTADYKYDREMIFTAQIDLK